MTKTCLFIDDADIRPMLEEVQRKARRDGIAVTCNLMVASDDFYDANDDLDLSKIKDALFNKYLKGKIDVIACDYDLSDEKISGLEIIQLVRERYSKQPIILYSGNLEKVLRKEIEGSGRDTGALVKKIKRIINWKIERFIDREECVDDVVTLLRDVNLEREIIGQLLVHKDLTLQHGYTKFKGKTLEDVAREIADETPNGLKFLQELVGRSVAHMIDLNKK